MKSKIRVLFPDIAMITMGLLLVVIFLWNNLFRGAVNFTPTVGTNDYMDMNVPYRKFYIDNILKGKIPVWSSEISSGYTIMASSELGSLNPLNLLTVKFEPRTSYAVSLAMAYFMILTFTYLYLRQIKISPLTALFGGVIAAFSGYAANQIMHLGWLNAYAYAIGELFLIERYIRSKKIIHIPLIGLLLGLSALGGHSQIIIYSHLFIYPYWFFRSMTAKEKIYKFIIAAGISAVLGLGIGAGQLLPTYEFTVNSTRSGGLNEASISLYSLNFRDIYTFIKPFAFYSDELSINGFATNGWPADEKYIYTGIIPIIAVIAGLYLAGKNVYTWIFFGALVFSWLFSLGNKTIFSALLKIPPVSFFRIPYRISFLMAISVAVLAAIGLEYIKKTKVISKIHSRTKLVLLILLILAVFFDLRYQAKKLYPEVGGNDWYTEPEVVSYLKQNLKNQERVTEEAYFDMSFPYFVGDHKLWEDPQMHKNLRNALPIFTNLLYSIPKNTPAANSGGLKVSRYNELESEIFFEGFEYKPDGEITVTDSFLFLNRIMGVRYILSNKEFKSYVTGAVKKIETGSGQAPVYVYEFFDYFPRQFMVPRAEKLKPEEIKDRLFKADIEPLQKIYVEEDVDWGAAGGFSATSEFISYSDTESEIKTQSSGDGFLFLSDTYYPGWRAYVDGREEEIYRANYAFRAVKVPAGEHRVVFKYEPESLRVGLKITGVSTAITIVLLVVGGLLGYSERREESHYK